MHFFYGWNEIMAFFYKRQVLSDFLMGFYSILAILQGGLEMLKTYQVVRKTPKKRKNVYGGGLANVQKCVCVSRKCKFLISPAYSLSGVSLTHFGVYVHVDIYDRGGEIQYFCTFLYLITATITYQNNRPEYCLVAIQAGSYF